MKTTTIGSFLTQGELDQCIDLWADLGETGTFAETVAREIITPVLPRINAALGQENDAKFLAYCIEAALAANS